MPVNKHLSPPWGQRVGGVSERPAQGNRRGAILSRALVATVEGTLVHRMPAAFAGCRTSVGLGRSVSSVRSRSLPLRAVGLATKGCPLVAAGGERRRRTPSVRTRLGQRATPRPMNEDTSFTRSRDPCTSIGTTTLLSVAKSAPSGRVCRGRSGIAVGQTCESGRNRHRGLIERTARGSPRVTALAREVVRDASRKGRWSRPSSLRGNESSGGARTSYCSCRSR
jgi:hypothetical protein